MLECCASLKPRQQAFLVNLPLVAQGNKLLEDQALVKLIEDLKVHLEDHFLKVLLF